ncbi:MAG: 2-hydroxyacyl-CoA dehydratase [Dethiobacter sp.]|jgi:bcr-type benzoyl-CoA reductase subunit C|nr:2-hydroxyacyl-CoA dehydratase [Dethiobacter sp.]MBS3900711.1 2-hydroxyacyl-CoA dehydratase [Dethiobacter sp.]MBS3989158.1 2-hydroxyacyl-CoA dehydratase [Dethiobacter sp.]
MESVLQSLLEVAANPSSEVSRWRQRTGGKVVGWLPIYVPEEIIHAAGALPVSLWGGRTEIVRADAHLQGFACSVVRAVLEYGLKGTYNMVDGFIFPSTCDHIQNTSDIWASLFPDRPKFDLVYPANRQSKAAVVYLEQLFADLEQWLEELTGQKVTSEKLRESVKIYNCYRALLADLFSLRSRKPESLSGPEMGQIVKSSLFLEKAEFNRHLSDLLPWLEHRKVKPAPKARLVLTGIMAEPQEILAILDELGGAIVADDLALGARILRAPVREELPLPAALVDRHLRLGPCSTLYDWRKGRGAHVQHLVAEHAADGVIFINMKFCEAEEFDYPVLKAELEEAGIPLLFLEVEQQMAAMGQIRTRLQAFLEVLGKGAGS